MNPTSPVRPYSDGACLPVGRGAPTTQWRAEEEWVWVPFQVDKRFDGFRVDQFLARRLTAYSRVRVQTMLNDSRVIRAEQRLKPSAKVHSGDQLYIAYPRQPEPPLSPDVSMPILYEDDDLVVVNKPADVLSHPTDKILNHTVLGILRHVRPDLSQLHLLHRLDRETSGVLALAKTRPVASAWAEAMASRRIHKEYIALVHGIPSPRAELMDWPIGRQRGAIKVRQWVNVPDAVPARTRYKVLATASLTPTLSLQGRGEEVRDGFSLVRVTPETGRLHQIRVHFAARGHPLLGDVLYDGDGALYLKMTRRQLTADDRQTLGFPRVALHAERLIFPHPTQGHRLCIAAPLPSDMTTFLQNHGMDKSDTLSSE